MKCMNYTSAYTGIASDTPVGVHLGPHLTKCGDPTLPTLEWWVLRAHTGIDGSLFFTPMEET